MEIKSPIMSVGSRPGELPRLETPARTSVPRLEELPMYLQRPSSGRSQSVTHVLAKTFRDVLARDVMGSDTIHNLTVSRGSPDEYHDRYVSSLQKVEERRTKCLSTISAVERHIMKAQGQAAVADEKEINRINERCRGYSQLGIRPAHAHFRAVVNSELLTRHNLVSPEDYALKYFPPVPAPPNPNVPHYARDTASTSTRRTSVRSAAGQRTESGLAVSDVSGIQDLDIHLHSECTSQFSREELFSRGKQNTMIDDENRMWKSHMDEKDRHQDRLSLANLESRSNFLRNPRFTLQNKSLTSTNTNQIFLHSPLEVVFNQYEVGKVYEMTLELKNVSTCLQTVRLFPPSSTYFSLGLGQYPGPSGVIASGLSCQFNIRFAPDSLIDYDDMVRVQTPGGQDLLIPLLGRRQPPKLTMNDIIDAGHCLVNGCRIVHFLIKNTGGNGTFCLMGREAWPASHFKSVVNASGVNLEPFRISPSVFQLSKNQSIVLEVAFTPQAVKIYQRSLTVVCNNCHVRHFTLKGQGQIAEVEFLEIEGGLSTYEADEISDETSDKLVRFDHLHPFTFTQKKLTVKNATNVELSYSWKLVKPNMRRPDSGSDESNDVHESGSVTDVAVTEVSAAVRVMDPESVFSAEPADGVLAPDASIDTTLTFAPPVVGLFHRVLHMVMHDIPDIQASRDSGIRVMDVAGLEMELKGESKPLIVDVQPYGVFVPGQLLMGSTIRKPIQLINRSLTPIIYQWEPITSGPIIEVELPIGEVGPSCVESLYVSITGSEPGKIKETLKCYIENVEEPLYLFVEADVKGPEVVIDEADVNLGLVRLGEMASMYITVQNLSNMAARWSLQESAAINYHDNPMAISELAFVPDSGELKPLQSRRVEIQFKAMSCRSVKTFIELLVEDGEERNLIVSAEVQEPDVCLLSCQLLIPDVYHNVATSQVATLYNKTLLPTTFQWLPHEGSQANLCLLSAEPASGLLGPREELEISVHFMAHELIEYTDVKLPCLIGGMENALYLSVMADTNGLDVSYFTLDVDGNVRDDLSVDMGQVDIMAPVERSLLLRNNSAIPSKFNLLVKNFKARPPSPPQKLAAVCVESNKRCLLSRRANLADPASKTQEKSLIDLSELMLRSGSGVAFSIEPQKGILSAFGEQLITIRGYSSMWGAYCDTVIAQVASLAPVDIPLRMNVSGCPLTFQIAAINRTPILRFGSHVAGVKPVTRPVKINNSSPFDIRLDWEVYTVISNDEKLVDLVVKYGKSFPIRDENGQEIAPSAESKPNIDRHTTNFTSDSPFTTPRYSLASRAPTLLTERPSYPKLVSLCVRNHEGVHSSTPYSLSPSQVIIPRKHYNTVNMTFSPCNVQSAGKEEDCSSFALAHLSITDEVAHVEERISRLQALDVPPLRIDLFAHIKPATLTIECDDDGDDETGGLKYTAAFSDLVSDGGELMSDCVRSAHCVLHNTTAARLTFALSTDTPFILLSPPAIHGSQKTPTVTLQPKQSMAVDVGFCLNLEMLKILEEQTEDSEVDGISWKTSTSGERRIHFRKELTIVYNNGTNQTLPLCAVVVVPSIDLSSETLDFGTCFVGQDRHMDLLLSNSTACASLWQVTVENECESCDNHTFSIEPNAGILEAYMTYVSKSKTTIRISFQAVKQESYEVTYLISGHLGEIPRRLHVKGKGSFDGCHEAIIG